MATFIEITYDEFKINVDFNQLSSIPSVAVDRWGMKRGFITDVQMYLNGEVIITTMRGQTHSVCALPVAGSFPNSLPIELINSEYPIDNDDLFNKIQGLL